MAIKGEKRGEKIFRWFVHIGAIVIAVIVTLYAFVFAQPCDLDKQYLYCRVHPTTIADIIGIVLFYLGCFGLSGLWFLITGDVDEDPGRRIVGVSFVLGLIGMGIMWA